MIVSIWGNERELDGNTFYSSHDMSQRFFQRFTLNVNDGFRIFVLPVKLSAHREHVLIVFIGIGVFGGFCKFIIVN